MDITPGQVAVITGAGSGIGRALALACAKRGMRVLVADIDYDAAAQTAERIVDLGAEVLAIRVDVSKPDQIQALAESCWQRFGACHLLCNNAGVSVRKPMGDCTPSDWQWVMSVNTLAVAYALSAFLPQMRLQDTAHIVNTASMAGLIPLPQFGAYVASKYALVGMSEVLAEELAAVNIGVSILCPGVVRTQIYHSERNRPDAPPPESPKEVEVGLQDEMQAGFDHAYSRIIDPAEVAEMALRAVIANRLYVPTHPEWFSAFERRSTQIADAFRVIRDENSGLLGARATP